MIKDLFKDVSLGLAFAGISYGVVNSLGYGPNSFTVNSYLYVTLGLTIGLRHTFTGRFSGFRDTLRNLVLVVEDEEVYMHRVLSGEKLKIKGDVERVQ